MSDDGWHALTIIAFVGSVFSPYYAYRRWRGTADPLDHCAINVALYGGAGKRWTMTERPRAGVQQTAKSLAIGPSALWWDADALTIRVDEITVPIPGRVRGTVKVFPEATTRSINKLDAEGAHMWWPIAPASRIEAVFQDPPLRWSGHGYLDANFGDRPLDTCFHRWDWSHASLRHRTLVLYEVERRDGTDLLLAMEFDRAGNASDFSPPALRRLPSRRWRIDRRTRADPEQVPAIVKTLEDTPFYARSIIDTALLSQRTKAMHECLSLDRFRKRWVRALLPFRMPRAMH